MRTLYLIRHCEPEREQGRCISQTEERLSAVGKEQAEHLARWIENHSVSAVVSSPQSRCLESAASLTVQNFGLADSILIDAGLRELSVGIWEGLSFGEIKCRWPDLYEARGISPATVIPPEGENFLQAGERLEQTLRRILKRTNGNVAVVTHAGILRGWIYRKLGIPEKELFSIMLPFGSVTEVLWNEAEFEIKTVGKKPNSAPQAAEIQALFERFQTPQAVRAHGYRVAEMAHKLARYPEIDEKVLNSACILHDLCRTQGRAHAQLARKALERAGYKEVADAIAQHHDLEQNASQEAELLYLADKLIQGTEEISLEERFEKSRGKCRDSEAVLAWNRRYEDAKRLMKKYGGE